jgi:ADP-L-glycero-D-manno-heptose 6-epimerase
MGWAFSVVLPVHITQRMILVTGGAGFIGSNLHAALTADGQEAVICDWLGHDGAKWRNFLHHPPAAIIRPEVLDTYLAQDMKITAIVHLGAISETTARDGDLVWESNVTLSQKLWRWCAERQVRFIYASSAATYGNGAAGFDDDMSLAALRKLKPLNLYGWSKHAFDLWVARQAAEQAPTPPNWAGVKFFNVFGPNEYHKGKMISVVKVKHDEVTAGGPVRLFKSDRADIADGDQKRDFIHVDDVVAALQFLLSAPQLTGIYNLGTGTARSYADLARAVCAANSAPARLEYIEMPEALRGQYQSFTQAPMARLRGIGFNHEFLTLEQGVDAYIKNHLLRADPYR